MSDSCVMVVYIKRMLRRGRLGTLFICSNGNWVNLSPEATRDLLQIYETGVATRYQLTAGLCIDILPNDVDCNSKNTDLPRLMRADLCYTDGEHQTHQQLSSFVKDLLESQGIMDAFPPVKPGDALPKITDLEPHRHLSLVPTPLNSARRTVRKPKEETVAEAEVKRYPIFENTLSPIIGYEKKRPRNAGGGASTRSKRKRSVPDKQSPSASITINRANTRQDKKSHFPIGLPSASTTTTTPTSTPTPATSSAVANHGAHPMVVNATNSSPMDPLRMTNASGYRSSAMPPTSWVNYPARTYDATSFSCQKPPYSNLPYSPSSMLLYSPVNGFRQAAPSPSSRHAMDSEYQSMYHHPPSLFPTTESASHHGHNYSAMMTEPPMLGSPSSAENKSMRIRPVNPSYPFQLPCSDPSTAANAPATGPWMDRDLWLEGDSHPSSLAPFTSDVGYDHATDAMVYQHHSSLYQPALTDPPRYNVSMMHLDSSSASSVTGDPTFSHDSSHLTSLADSLFNNSMNEYNTKSFDGTDTSQRPLNSVLHHSATPPPPPPLAPLPPHSSFSSSSSSSSSASSSAPPQLIASPSCISNAAPETIAKSSSSLRSTSTQSTHD
ncbi:uncharacterized protein BYT42DRAFT_546481 [Radiomyces spectabilis]|uniref:uncharacterized protein n=1 Tax=Radiomyces spectabilis TaxID=64574 RepID=UPI00221E629C|nr:uncharacterized protein BYT42DRAFT_546481 [Radiomyces spectabilis]KAI8377856.1 hypothetical protein BYT42DRAFT_546481 [Radiomyces spectabilis]